MPPTNEEFRRLHDDFRAFLAARAAWPPVKAFREPLRKYGGGGRKYITSMKYGRTVPAKFIDSLIDLLWDRPVLTEYLAELGCEVGRDALGHKGIANLIAGPLRDRPGPADDEFDWFTAGIRSISELVDDFVWGPLFPPSMRCNSERDVRKACRMCLVAFGHELRKRPDPLPDDAAVRLAADYMGTTEEAYSAQAITFWYANEWTTLFGTVSRRRIACSTIIPMKEESYAKVRDGEITAHSCTVEDLQPTSRTLMIEHLGMVPDDVYPSRREKSGKALKTIFLQAALLSLTPERVSGYDPRPLRILTFGGNAQHATRARKYGFKPTGAKIPGYDVDIYELTIDRGWFLPLVIWQLQERLIKLGFGHPLSPKRPRLGKKSDPKPTD